MTREPLTHIQASVLRHLRAFHAEQDQLPPYHSVATHFGWKSPNAAYGHYQQLVKKGWIERNSVGGFRFTRPKAPEAACQQQ